MLKEGDCLEVTERFVEQYPDGGFAVGDVLEIGCVVTRIPWPVPPCTFGMLTLVSFMQDGLIRKIGAFCLPKYKLTVLRGRPDTLKEPVPE